MAQGLKPGALGSIHSNSRTAAYEIQNRRHVPLCDLTS